MKTFTLACGIVAVGSAQAITIRNYEFNNSLNETGGNTAAEYCVGGTSPASQTAQYTTATIGGQTATVSRFDKNGTYKITENFDGNGVKLSNGSWIDATYVNHYTIITDVKFDQASSSYISFYNTAANNSDDGELFFKGSGTSWKAGISDARGGGYGGSINPFEWNRVALVVNCETTDQGNDGWFRLTTFDVYVNGDLIQKQYNPWSAQDGGWSLGSNQGQPALFWLFGDNDGETASGWVNSLLVADGEYTAAQIKALGGATAAGLGQPVPEPMSMIALGLGAVGLITRRRRK